MIDDIRHLPVPSLRRTVRDTAPGALAVALLLVGACLVRPAPAHTADPSGRAPQGAEARALALPDAAAGRYLGARYLGCADRASATGFRAVRMTLPPTAADAVDAPAAPCGAAPRYYTVGLRTAATAPAVRQVGVTPLDEVADLAIDASTVIAPRHARMRLRSADFRSGKVDVLDVRVIRRPQYAATRDGGARPARAPRWSHATVAALGARTGELPAVVVSAPRLPAAAEPLAARSGRGAAACRDLAASEPRSGVACAAGPAGA